METEIYEDDGIRLSPTAAGPSPPPRPNKLRRLRRASSSTSADPHTAPDPDVSLGPAPIEVDTENPVHEMSPDADGFDPLFSVPAQDEDREIREREDEGDGVDGTGESGREGKKSAKKRLSLEGDGGEETSNKKRSKSCRSAADGGKHKESVREMRRLEKERRAHLELIHVESQRLLRETRNASFKPVPLVQKPISSVLERIRQRKLEVLKSSSCSIQLDSSAGAHRQMGEIAQKSDLSEPQNDGRENDEITKVMFVSRLRHSDVHVVEEGRRSSSPLVPSGSVPDNEISDEEESKDNHQNDTEDISNDSQLNSVKINKNTEDTLKDSLVSSLSTPSLKHDSADYSSEEEESDKENANPHPYKIANMNSYAEDNLAKDFLDDEAEEEDDSDHDLMSLRGNEDDEESDENELLKDLIATDYEEASVDQEKRNELHQKWLKQQDDAETENVVQKLLYKEPFEENINSEAKEEDDEEPFEDSGDETLCEQIPLELAKKNLKKAKQMIAHMFTDENDAYVPSDDEETEQTLIRQHILKQNEEEPSFISPMEDANSKEVFGLIKKLNIAPDTKKKTKFSKSSLDMLLNGGNSSSSSKSSFLGRAMNNSLPSSHKQGSSTMRTFIFGRDDSNSKSSISVSANHSDMDQKENQLTKTAQVKVSGSQFKTTVFKTKVESKTSSGSSLFEILRQSSMHFDKQLENRNQGGSSTISETRADFQFSAFKIGKKN